MKPQEKIIKEIDSLVEQALKYNSPEDRGIYLSQWCIETLNPLARQLLALRLEELEIAITEREVGELLRKLEIGFALYVEKNRSYCDKINTLSARTAKRILKEIRNQHNAQKDTEVGIINAWHELTLTMEKALFNGQYAPIYRPKVKDKYIMQFVGYDDSRTGSIIKALKSHFTELTNSKNPCRFSIKFVKGFDGRDLRLQCDASGLPLRKVVEQIEQLNQFVKQMIESTYDSGAEVRHTAEDSLKSC